MLMKYVSIKLKRNKNKKKINPISAFMYQFTKV